MAGFAKTLNTRISLKYDLYSNWSTNNPILLKGEIALAYIPTDSSLNVGNSTVTGTTPPNVMMKVGDGTSHYNDLKFVSGLAADVASWAKAADKPEYSASEIKDLASYINGQVQDTNTEYNLVKVNDYQYKLMSKGIGDENFTTEVAVIDIPKYDDTELSTKVGSLETAVGVLNGNAETAGSVAKSIADAIAALKLSETYAAKVHTHTKSEITDFAHTHEMSEVNGLADALAGKEAAGAAAAALEEAKGYADGKDEAIAAAKKAGDDAQDDVDTLAALVGSLPEGATATTLVGYVEEKTGDKATVGTVNALTDRVAANEGAIATISGDYLKAADKEALQGSINGVSGALTEEVNRATAKENEISGALDTYKTANDERVAAVEGEVDALQIQIGGLTGAMHFKGVVDAVPADGAEGYVSGDVVVVSTSKKEYVYDGAKWYELGDEGSFLTKTEAAQTYETKADASAKAEAQTNALNGEIARAKAAEEANAKAITDLDTAAKAAYETKTDASAKLAEAKKYADDQDAIALAAAKEYADGKASGAQAAAIEAAAADAKSKADAALASAKEYADGLDKAMDERVDAIEAKPAMGLTAEQIAEYEEAVGIADSAVQSIEGAADGGIAVSRTGNNVVLSLDNSVTFTFDCGTSEIEAQA